MKQPTSESSAIAMVRAKHPDARLQGVPVLGVYLWRVVTASGSELSGMFRQTERAWGQAACGKPQSGERNHERM